MRFQAALLLLALALSGCSGNKADTDAETPPVTPPSPPPAAPLANQAPVANLTASVTAGSEPLAVEFQVEATDGDGDALTWSLDFGDGGSANGTELPASANHTYADAGAYTAVLTVSDGTQQANATLELNVTAAAAVAQPPILLTGHVTAPSPSYNTEGECLEPILTPLAGRDDFGKIFAVPPEAIGWDYAFDVAGMTAIFFNADFSDNLQEGPSGQVPEGAVNVIACSAMAVDTDYALALAQPA